MAEKITPAMRRALQATADGQVVRVYRANGNILRGPKGISPKVLWAASTSRWIEDGPESWGGIEKTCRQVLTAAGKVVLEGK